MGDTAEMVEGSTKSDDLAALWPHYIVVCGMILVGGCLAASATRWRSRRRCAGNSSAAGNPSSDVSGPPPLGWKDRMREVRFRQQLEHWAAGNTSFRATRENNGDRRGHTPHSAYSYSSDNMV
jgi:hypothetical protein